MQPSEPTVTIEIYDQSNQLTIARGHIHLNINILEENNHKNQNVKILYVWECSISKQGFCSLIKIESCQKVLIKLCSFDQKSFRMFDRAQFKNIQELRLNNCGLNAEDMLSLSKTSIPFLKKLLLYNFCYENPNKIKGKGLNYLLQENWVELTVLNLNGNKITDQGIQALGASNISSLKLLFLGQSYFTYKGMQKLIKSSFISNLEKLHLNSIKLSLNEEDQFKQQTRKMGVKFNISFDQ